MKPQDIFGLAIRVLGLVLLFAGFMGVPIFVRQLFSVGFWHWRVVLELVLVFVQSVALPLLLAVWFLRGAPLLVRLAYPGRDPRSDGRPEQQ